MNMENSGLIDYIYWRGDLTFAASPFNDVDNAILCELCYLDLTPVFSGGQNSSVTLRRAYQIIQQSNSFHMMSPLGDNEEFVAAAAESRRFGDIIMSDYLDSLDFRSTQFSAIHFHLNSTLNYIAFRGTDDSLIGWKEDLMMSFENVPAQKSALTYLSQTMKDGITYYVGGHSKGANLAIYAVAFLPEERRNQVKRVFANDGPGFSPLVHDMKRIEEIVPKITRIIPYFDVIGQIFYMEIPDTKIVNSEGSGLLQHDLMTWKVKGSKFSLAKNTDPSVPLIRSALDHWIKSSDMKARKAFVDVLFENLTANGEEHVDEIRLRRLPQVISGLLMSGEEAKQVALNLPKSALESAKTQLEDVLTRYMQDEIEKHQEKQERTRQESEKAQKEKARREEMRNRRKEGRK